MSSAATFQGPPIKSEASDETMDLFNDMAAPPTVGGAVAAAPLPPCISGPRFDSDEAYSRYDLRLH